MYNHRNKRYDKDNKNYKEEVVQVITIPQTKSERKVGRVKADTEVQKKKKRSALEISDSIGVYGAFDRTLCDLHKQGR